MEQMLPSDLLVVFRVEFSVADVVLNRVIHVSNQIVIQSQPGDGRQVTLGDAVRHVDALRISPFGNDVSASHDRPAGCATSLRWTQDLSLIHI